MPQRVTFLITDLHVGGTPRMLSALAAGLARDGRFMPTVVSLAPLPAAPAPVVAALRTAGIHVASLDVTRPTQLGTALARWKALLAAQNPAVVYSLLIHANLIATLGRRSGPPQTRYIQALHTMQPRPRWHWWLQGRLARHADLMLAPAQCILDRLARFGPVPNGIVIPNGIDVARFQNALPLEPHPAPSAAPDSAAPAPPWPPGARVVGYIGRFDPVKRLPWLIQAFAQILRSGPQEFRDLHLALVGYGPAEPALRAAVQRCGIPADRVHFPGRVDAPERWLKSFSCFALPSEAEGQPLSVIEALVAGVPVVGFAIPALREVVGPDYPLVKNSGPDALAIAITEVMRGDGACRQAAGAARSAAQRFSENRMLLGHITILEKICAAPQISPSPTGGAFRR